MLIFGLVLSEGLRKPLEVDKAVLTRVQLLHALGGWWLLYSQSSLTLCMVDDSGLYCYCTFLCPYRCKDMWVFFELLDEVVKLLLRLNLLFIESINSALWKSQATLQKALKLWAAVAKPPGRCFPIPFFLTSKTK